MQQVLFRIPFKTAWFPERFPFWAAVVTLAWVVLIIFWVVARLGTPRESGRWSFSSALPACRRHWRDSAPEAAADGRGDQRRRADLRFRYDAVPGILAVHLACQPACRARRGAARPFRTWPSGYSSADSSAPASRSCCTRTQVLPSCACRMSCCSSGRAASSSTAPSWGDWQGSCCAGGLFFASKAFPP